MYFGINLSGGEFGSKTPGTLDKDFTIPKWSEASYFIKEGVGEMVRIPFRWRTLNNAPLAASAKALLLKGAGDPKREKGRIDDLVNSITLQGKIAILDMHDYGKPRGIGQIGTGKPDVKWFCDMWVAVIQGLDPELVWIDLMNEPANSTSWQAWQEFQQSAVILLREMGVTNKIIVNGGSWMGAHDFVSSGRAAGMLSFSDPADNYVIGLHQYLDKDKSGTKAEIVAGSGKRFDDALAWAEQNGKKLFIGEFGVPDTSAHPEWQAEVVAAMTALAKSPAVVGITAWGGGAWWAKDYPFRLAPLNGAETPQMTAYKAAVEAVRDIVPSAPPPPPPTEEANSFACPHCGTKLDVTISA